LLPAPIWHVGKLLVVALIVEYLVLPQLAGTRKALHLLSQVRPAFLLLGVLLEALALVAYAQLTRTVLPDESDPGLYTVLRIQLTTLSVSHCVPAGSAAGSSLGYRLLTLAGAGKADVGLAMGLQASGSAVVLNFIFWVALVASIPVWGFSPLYLVVGVVGLILVALFAVLVLLLTRGQRWANAMIDRASARIHFLDGAALHATSERLAVRFHQLGADKRLVVKATIWAALNWLLDAGSLYVFVGAFGHWVNPDGLVLAFSIAHVLAAIPITPGGLGLVEATLTSTLVGFNTPRGIAILGVIGYRLVNFWLPIPVGGLAYLSLHIDPGHTGEHRRSISRHQGTPAIADQQIGEPGA
ncbi:MAG: YbhN family protein, partial [Actinomycetota bacterium]|nr:YbhN family protein [Actinomycetota bacterium]